MKPLGSPPDRVPVLSRTTWLENRIFALGEEIRALHPGDLNTLFQHARELVWIEKLWRDSGGEEMPF